MMLGKSTLDQIILLSLLLFDYVHIEWAKLEKL